MRWIAALAALSMFAASTHSLDLTTQHIANAPIPGVDPVLELHPDGTTCVAYYSESSGAIVFGQWIDDAFQFETVETVSAWTEVSLAIDAEGTIYLAYKHDGLELAQRVGATWEKRRLNEMELTGRLDMEFDLDGGLNLAFASADAVVILRLLGTAQLQFQLSGRPGVESIDLEYAPNGSACLVYWQSVVGGTYTDAEWGRTYLVQAPSPSGPWLPQAFDLGRWGRNPALAFDEASQPCVTLCRINNGQMLLRRVASETAPEPWVQTHLSWTPTASIEASAGLVSGPAGRLYVLSRSHLWKLQMGILDQTSLNSAQRVGREGLQLKSDGQLQAIYRVNTALYFARVTPDPQSAPTIQSFTGPSSIARGDAATLTWHCEATGVSLEPGGFAGLPIAIQSVAPWESTTYVLTAINFDGMATSSHTIEVVPTAPVINAWTADANPVTATEEFRLYRDCKYADRIRIDPIGFESTDPRGNRLTNITETTTFVLSAFNDVGVTRDSLTVVVDRPFEIRTFRASHGIIGSADPVALSWEVFGLANVEIETVGPVAPTGSIFVVPGESRDYVLRAEWEGHVETASVSVLVDDSFQESRFYLSFAPDAVVTDPPQLSLYQTFPVYVLGLSLDGGAIAGVEFGVELPDGLLLAGADFHSDRAINVLTPPDFVVGLGECHILGDLHLLATLQFMPHEQRAIDEGSVRLRPAIIASIEGRVAYATCALDLNGSEIEGPIAQALQGPPLYLSAQRVPTLQLGFRARRDGQVVRLEWNAIELGHSLRLELARSWNGLSWQALASWQGEMAGGQGGWQDAAANHAAQYRLRAFDGEALLVEEFAQVFAAPLPVLTRLLTARPNPFNPRTSIHWAAARAGVYEFGIFNGAGRRVKHAQQTVAAAGEYALDWDGRDESGNLAASGVYYVRLVGQDAADGLRLLLLK